MRTLSRSIAALLLPLLLFAGCTATRILERRIVQAQGPDGAAAYYRITIRANAELARSHYRAGWYDPAALEAALGGIKSNVETDAAQGNAALTEAPGLQPDAGEAFAIIYSANASEIADMIAAFVEEQETLRILASALQIAYEAERTDLAADEAELDQTIATLIRLQQQLAALSPGEDPASRQAYTRRVSEIALQAIGAAR